MNCPACGAALTALEISGLTVDGCQASCAGIWFDQAELRSLDDPAVQAGEALVAFAGTPKVAVNPNERRRCPKCPDSILMRHFYSARRVVAVDECPTCAGVWLDGGELEQIRREFESGGARRQAAQALAEEILASDRMTLMRKQVGDELPYDTFRSRVAASVLVGVYFLLALGLSGGALAMRMMLISVVPWACVCFPDALSGAISPMLGTTRASHRWFVWFFGWVVLLLPMIQLAIVWVEIAG
jgi:Zn-finger nucleic acid-binding protein